ncbi:MAG: hypothetical protein HQ564_01900 [Candidatus Saganbacteria bacterium]|nr:hypothetical protein [Candidatus Saganbacteria bacterium]
MSDFIFQAEEEEFPSPSEKNKINKAIDRANFIISKFGNRPDVVEEKFHLADLYVGRGSEGDYDLASQIYDDLLSRHPYPYLKARCLIGKSELAIPEIKKEEIPVSLDICNSAQTILKKLSKDEKMLPTFPFFRDKAFIIEAELKVTRDETDKKGKHLDHIAAQKIYESIMKDRKSNWYFRARANLGKAELLSFHNPSKVWEGIKLAEKAANLLRGRPQDYFAQKSIIIDAELRMNRGNKDDLKKAQELLNNLVNRISVYPDLLARTKLDLAQLSRHPKAQKLYEEVIEMEGLDPYILKKSKLVEEKLGETQKKKRKK